MPDFSRTKLVKNEIPIPVKSIREGFRSHSDALKVKGISLNSECADKNAVNSWLARTPHRYPVIPAAGMTNHTNMIRIPSPAIL